MKQTTMSFKRDNVKYYVVDAENKHLGRLAVEIANTLRGKDKPEFVLNQDVGDGVIVLNSKKIVLTGKKWDQKIYYSHSGKPGNLKEVIASKLHEKDPTKVIYKAVKGMLPRNKLAAIQLKRLRIFEDDQHNMSAQKPEKVETLRRRGLND